MAQSNGFGAEINSDDAGFLAANVTKADFLTLLNQISAEVREIATRWGISGYQNQAGELPNLELYSTALNTPVQTFSARLTGIGYSTWGTPLKRMLKLENSMQNQTSTNGTQVPYKYRNISVKIILDEFKADLTALNAASVVPSGEKASKVFAPSAAGNNANRRKIINVISQFKAKLKHDTYSFAAEWNADGNEILASTTAPGSTPANSATKLQLQTLINEIIPKVISAAEKWQIPGYTSNDLPFMQKFNWGDRGISALNNSFTSAGGRLDKILAPGGETLGIGGSTEVPYYLAKRALERFGTALETLSTPTNNRSANTHLFIFDDNHRTNVEGKLAKFKSRLENNMTFEVEINRDSRADNRISHGATNFGNGGPNSPTVAQFKATVNSVRDKVIAVAKLWGISGYTAADLSRVR